MNGAIGRGGGRIRPGGKFSLGMEPEPGSEKYLTLEPGPDLGSKHFKSRGRGRDRGRGRGDRKYQEPRPGPGPGPVSGFQIFQVLN